ncbi:MAG: SHOCT domain-containing protein [Desulfobacteraceae bacterium]|nr:MAG: SHOCT domain-containing protein [Desulfobacteraceae bacterium]
MKLNKFGKEGIFRSIFTAYFILLLHVFLLAGTGVSVILFRGLYQYLPWIIAGITLAVLFMAWMVYRKMRADSTQIRDIMGLPEFKDREVEVKLLGGLMSMKVSASKPSPQLPALESPEQGNIRLIEDSVSNRERRIVELTALYEKNLITTQDFETAKQKILHG